MGNRDPRNTWRHPSLARTLAYRTCSPARRCPAVSRRPCSVSRPDRHPARIPPYLFAPSARLGEPRSSPAASSTDYPYLRIATPLMLVQPPPSGSSSSATNADDCDDTRSTLSRQSEFPWRLHRRRRKPPGGCNRSSRPRSRDLGKTSVKRDSHRSISNCNSHNGYFDIGILLDVFIVLLLRW